jgi:hypothetical protein
VAKKTRTPPPPRRPGPPPGRRPAPAKARPPLDERRRRQIYWGGGGLAVVAVVAIVLAILLSGGGSGRPSDADVAKAMAAAGCTFKSVKPLPPTKDKTGARGGYHLDVPSLTTKVKWSTDPPSGGAHYPLWAVWGFYTDPVNPRQVVHNEEHGGMIMWWGSKVPSSEVDKLNAFYSESPDGMVGTPYPKLGDKIALTAWTGDPTKYYRNGYYGIGHVAVCSSYSQKAFTTFRDAYRGRGPEGIPLSADKVGTGPNG